MSSSGLSPTIEVNAVGLIVGVSVASTIVLVIIIVFIVICIRNRLKRKKKDRSRLYVVHDGISPFSSVHGPPSNGVISSYNASGYDNKGLSTGELRQNPLAEDSIYSPHMKTGVSMIQIPPTYSEMQGGPQPYHQRLGASTQSLQYSDGSRDTRFWLKIYENLQDTTHVHKGRPLYLCKRSDYIKLNDYFDIIGKTRLGDWLIRPRANVPNRPKRRSNKKRQAPKPDSNGFRATQEDRWRVSGGLMGRPGATGIITTPFGAAERLPHRYLSGSQLNITRENNQEPLIEPQYTSLPRDGNLHHYHNGGLKRQPPSGKADGPTQLDEKMYADVVMKYSSNQEPESPVVIERRNPNRSRIFNTIEENPKSQLDVPVGHRERSGSTSTLKSLGITDQFKFLDQYETEEERF